MPSYFPENNTPQVLDTEVKSLQKINGAAQSSLGQIGFIYADSTAPVSGNFTAIQVLSSGSSTFTALSASNSTVGALGTSVALIAGSIIYGPFTGFTLATNSKVIAYKT